MRIPSPERRLDAYPHELSGGMRQRAMIAMALSCSPRLLLADEPTTALDATVQVQVLILLRKLQRELGMGMIFVTHDLGVAAEIADTVAVMYAGRIVESRHGARRAERAGAPLHRGLLASTVHGQPRDRDIEAIPGSPPDMRRLRRAAPSRRAAQSGCRNARRRARAAISRARADGGLPRRARRRCAAAVKPSVPVPQRGAPIGMLRCRSIGRCDASALGSTQSRHAHPDLPASGRENVIGPEADAPPSVPGLDPG